MLNTSSPITDTISRATNKWIKVVSGHHQVCGIKKEKNNINSLWCWGALQQNGSKHIIGDNKNTIYNIPQKVSRINSAWTQVTVGGTSTFASSSNTVFPWGHSELFRYDNLLYTHNDGLGLGLNRHYEQRPSIVEMRYVNTILNMKESGGNSSCSIGDDKKIYCWGKLKFSLTGPTGRQSYSGFSEPYPLDFPNSNLPTSNQWKALSVFANSFCAINIDNSLWCNKAEKIDEFSYDVTLNSLFKVQIPLNQTWDSVSLSANWSMVTAYSATTLNNEMKNTHFCAISMDKKLYCWGDNSFGQLGIQATTTQLDPTPVSIVVNGITIDNSNTKWIKVVSNNNNTCALDDVGNLYCWGFDIQKAPLQVAGVWNDFDTASWNEKIDNRDYSYYGCGIQNNIDLLCWGDNQYGQLGTGNINPTINNQAVAVIGNHQWKMTTDKNVSTFGTGKGHACAIDVTGDLFCWGLNDQGQLGIGNTWATEPVKTTVP